MVATRKSGRNLRSWVAWFLQERRRGRLAAHGAGLPLPGLAHHPLAGVPGVALRDESYPNENPGALITDIVELWVLDPSVATVLGDPPTEADWLSAASALVAYDPGPGSWHYESADIGSTKGDADFVWIKGRFVRAGQPGPWGGVAQAVWSF